MNEHRQQAQKILGDLEERAAGRYAAWGRWSPSAPDWADLACAGVHALLAISAAPTEGEGVISERELKEARQDPEVVATLDEADRVRDPDRPIFTPPKLDRSPRTELHPNQAAPARTPSGRLVEEVAELIQVGNDSRQSYMTIASRVLHALRARGALAMPGLGPIDDPAPPVVTDSMVKAAREVLNRRYSHSHEVSELLAREALHVALKAAPEREWRPRYADAPGRRMRGSRALVELVEVAISGYVATPGRSMSNTVKVEVSAAARTVVERLYEAGEIAPPWTAVVGVEHRLMDALQPLLAEVTPGVNMEIQARGIARELLKGFDIRQRVA